MDSISFSKRQSWQPFCVLLMAAYLISTTSFGQTKFGSFVKVEKWGVFEREIRTSVSYPDPLRRIELNVEFTSPQGNKIKSYGFWDGGRVWKIRFSPNLPGKWTYETSCSDPANTNLHKVKGEFLCVATKGKTRFDLHGPIHLSQDQIHLEHQDHTPFLWLGDTVWNGALASKSAEWQTYSEKRFRQGFTVAQWMAAPGKNLRNHHAFDSTATTLTINPAFFEQLDSRIETLNHAGLLSAILPLREATGQDVLEVIPEDQAIQLLRYMVARWGAYHVAWIILCEGDNVGIQVARWKRIGRAVFGDRPHAPIILYCGATYWVLEEFHSEPWVDILGYQSGQETTDDSLQWLLAGPLSTDWQRLPAKPFMNMVPVYERLADDTSASSKAPMTRRILLWSLLNVPTTGVGYGAEGVWNWSQDLGNKRTTSALVRPAWQRNLSMPIAEEVQAIINVFNSFEFWQLKPAREMLVTQPGDEHPAKYISAAQSPDRNIALIYIPEERSVDLNVNALPPSPKATWINPRTGERIAATQYVSGSICRFITPQSGDWLLLIQSDK
jgi:Protein of unknown function (DUF4038)/Domain of unknown function (DUF5060)/Putative collagen-binding domain of a collagenase